MKWKTKQIFWIVVYFALIFAPLLILLLAPRPAGRTFWRELSVALGFAGLSLMGLQFIPTARLPFLSEVFPLDTLYAFHHRLSVTAFLLTLAHPLILFIHNPYTLTLLNIFTAPWRARAAVAATVAMIFLVFSSVKRLSLKLSYEAWRVLHDVLSVAVVGFALYHIFKVNYYTSIPVQRWLWVVMGILWALMILYIRVFKPIQLLRRPYEIVEVIRERGNTWSLNLKPVGHAGRTFRAGQVAWLSIGHSPFRIEEHPFSYASIKELGDFTAKIKQLKPGDRVFVDGPYGSFSVDKFACRQIVFIAGGIGSAPVMSMLRTLASRKDERQIIFVYGNPGYEDIIYREELETLQKQLNLKLIHVLENPPADWQGEQGYITQSILARHLPENYKDWIYFLCGPLPMTNAVGKCLHALHIPKKHIHLEKYEMA